MSREHSQTFPVGSDTELSGVARVQQEAKALSHPFNQPGVPDSLYFTSQVVYPRADQYDVIVGEDTSGRLPALVIAGVVNARRSKLGLAPVAQRFVSGRCNEPQLPDGFLPEPTRTGAKALIVTEYISMGTSIINTYDIVNRSSSFAAIDIASLAVSSHGRKRVEGKIRQDDSVLLPATGNTNYILSALYGENSGGTYKSKGVSKVAGPPFANRLRSDWDPYRVARARADIKILVNSIVQAFEEEEANVVPSTGADIVRWFVERAVMIKQSLV
jgi:hypothetical protein